MATAIFAGHDAFSGSRTFVYKHAMRNRFFSREALIRFLLLLPLLALAVFCIFYLSGNYASLAGWYESLGGPFFRSAYWRTEFFTPQVWETGKQFCAFSLFFIIPVLALSILKGKMPTRPEIPTADARNAGFVAGVAVLLGVFNAIVARPAIDEYQSALFMGGAHPFRALTHYPVPNNHVLFNTLNALFATPETAFISGKILAILFYAGAGALLYLWFRQLAVGRRAATVLALLALTPFPVWGFSGQARGYTLYLLAHWWTLLLATRYLQTEAPRTLFWFPVALLVGYAALPTFIYFHLALLFWAVFLGFSRKKIYLPFWKAQALGSLAALLFYVPLLAFSGVKALSGHRWVARFGWRDFSFPPLGPFRDYLTGYGAVGYALGICTALLSLGLLFSKKTRWIGALFCALWLGCNAVVLLMRQPSFSRQLNGLFSVSAAIALWAVWLLVEKTAAVFSGNYFKKAAVLVGLSGAVGVLALDYSRLDDALYLYKIRETEARIQALLQRIPEGATVGFTDDAFHAQALWQRSGKRVVPLSAARYRVHLKGADPVLPSDSLISGYGDLELFVRRR